MTTGRQQTIFQMVVNVIPQHYYCYYQHNCFTACRFQLNLKIHENWGAMSADKLIDIFKKDNIFKKIIGTLDLTM